MYKRVLVLVVILLASVAVNDRPAKADDNCSGGYTIWYGGYPYCWPSSNYVDCYYCSVYGGDGGHQPLHPVP